MIWKSLKELTIQKKKKFENKMCGNSVIQNERTQKCSAWLHLINSHDLIHEVPALSLNKSIKQVLFCALKMSKKPMSNFKSLIGGKEQRKVNVKPRQQRNRVKAQMEEYLNDLRPNVFAKYVQSLPAY